ncbi:MAG: CCA tRNA nucleotidyltransferase [Alphaproteobacteria bacterium GM202ARS2]|nr:CCA tRNA nucleotidyltransferase [Alphaproteobacteria bacterium GM202ARS2]
MPATHRIVLPAYLRSPAVRRIFTCLARNGQQARFVGGCVRDSILHRPIYDIDIATTTTPKQTMQWLRDDRILTIPSGIRHGTVTALLSGITFEITTLREDIETFGRHARVTFTTDWHLDARRRDFTMNALYADQDGTVYDFFDGIRDARQRRVRFIGVPHERINEDYLRILRFFRFLASHGSLPADEEALAACRQLADQLAHVSAERLWKEIALLLKVANPTAILALMARCRVLAHLPELAVRVEPIRRLCRLDTDYGGNVALRRFTAMLKPETHADTVAERWRFSGKQKKKLHTLLAATTLAKKPWRTLVYRYGHSMLRDILLLSARPYGFMRCLYALRIGNVLNHARRFKAPRFPIRGKDLVALGYPQDSKLGARLAQTEAWWLKKNLTPNKQQCLDYVANNTPQKDTKP